MAWLTYLYPRKSVNTVPMRPKIIAGNWKMNNNLEDALGLTSGILSRAQPGNTRVILCVPSPLLYPVATQLQGHPGFFCGAQQVHQEEKGAFTGEVSASMLRSVGVDYVIIGHSERRQLFGEKNDLLAAKTSRALASGLRPLFCCGEPLHVRAANGHIRHVARQLKAALFQLSPEEISQLVIAYEPVWAIGTGQTASNHQAQEMHAAIRQMIAGKYGAQLAENVPILYGGSVTPASAPELFTQPDVDGGLVGGASLKADDFVAIIHAAKAVEPC